MTNAKNANPLSPENAGADTAQFVRNVVVKGLALFLIANLLFAFWYPMEGLGRISGYNRLFPGRQRLPYGENPSQAYNLSLYNLEAMFASHELDGAAKADDEYRVILIGDSSVWGFLLPVEDTLSASLDAASIHLPDGRRVRAYNLGYPVMSLTKDLLILSYAKQYEPDMIIWPLTLESFPYDKQLFPPLLQNNPGAVEELNQIYGLTLAQAENGLSSSSFAERTIVGSRRALADLIRLQAYGVLWGATGIDQDIPKTYTPRIEDFAKDDSFHNLSAPDLNENDLAFDVLAAGVAMAEPTPVLIINEPIFISQGENSEIRYNFFYPRWAYDDYRQMILTQSIANQWYYRDLWDIIPGNEFTNSAVHLSASGTQQLSMYIIEAILETAQQASR
ncbi:hypothetical protein ACFLZW_00270 [Chloroflexota bacterium]